MKKKEEEIIYLNDLIKYSIYNGNIYCRCGGKFCFNWNFPEKEIICPICGNHINLLWIKE